MKDLFKSDCYSPHRFAVRGLFCAGLLGVSMAHATVLRVEIGSTRSRDAWETIVDNAVLKYASNAAILTQRERRFNPRSIFPGLPVTVMPTRNGVTTPPPGRTRGDGDPIVLQFSTDPTTQFPTDYQTFLQQVATKAQPVIDAVFGKPSNGGNVKVSNFDATIGDREALTGGYYVTDGSNQEIRFPVYADGVGYKKEVAAVNFIHCMLLATIGAKTLPGDGWQEGVVRAAVMRICRTAGALPSDLDPVSIEQVLSSSYDVGAYYDLNNQSALSGPQFIATNLRDQALPAGGSTGGLYLLRYQMAGSALQKVLVEYPGFLPEFFSRYYPAYLNFQSLGSISALGDQVITALGGPGSTLEGLTFTQWARRQRVLDPARTVGPKLLVQPFAITDGLAGSDFGVFAIQAHWFRTERNGNETLLRDTSYPIYWSPDFTRFFTAIQDDKLSIFAGYGSVVPNFPSSAFAGQPYRVSVDVPVQDSVARIYLPAGAVSQAGFGSPNTVFGCLTGIDVSATDYSVLVSFPLGDQEFPVRNGAFGGQPLPTFLDSQRSVGLIVKKSGVEVFRRTVNKGPGPLGVNLHVGGEGTVTVPSGIPRGVSLLGLIGEPFANQLPDVLNSSPLVARWDPAKAAYNRGIDFNSAGLGQGFYARSQNATPLTYDGLNPGKVSLAAACKPGWNMVCNPLSVAVSKSDLQVIVASKFPRSFDDALAAGQVGTDLFAFAQGAADPLSGIAESGTTFSESLIQPGQAFFIKVFAPEGATLLFPHTSTRTRSRESSPYGWGLDLQISRDQEQSRAILAAHPKGSRGLDRALDSELPPSQGGPQVALQGGKRLYRDVRGMNRTERFQARLEGLRVGETYRITLTELGKLPTRWVVSGPVRRTIMNRGGTLTFRASAKSMLLNIEVTK